MLPFTFETEFGIFPILPISKAHQYDIFPGILAAAGRWRHTLSLRRKGASGVRDASSMDDWGRATLPISPKPFQMSTLLARHRFREGVSDLLMGMETHPLVAIGKSETDLR